MSAAATDAKFAKINYGTTTAVREMTVPDLLRHTAGLAYAGISQNATVRKALRDTGIFKTTIEYDAQDLSGAEQVERLSKVPLAHQPGAMRIAAMPEKCMVTTPSGARRIARLMRPSRRAAPVSGCRVRESLLEPPDGRPRLRVQDKLGRIDVLSKLRHGGGADD